MLNVTEIANAFKNGHLSLPAAIECLDNLGYTEQEIKGIISGAINALFLDADK